jgi:hypothetical protein
MKNSNACKSADAACVEDIATLRNGKTVVDTSQDSSESNSAPLSKGGAGKLTITVKNAIWRHDVFNLFALGILNSLNFRYMYYGEGARPFQPCSCASTAFRVVMPAKEPVTHHPAFHSWFFHISSLNSGHRSHTEYGALNY